MNIKNVLEYAKTLLGIKYALWEGGSLTTNVYPFYVNVPPSDMNISFFRKHGMNCAGFINILLWKFGRGVPFSGDAEVDEWRGGTYFWHHYFDKIGALKVFDIDAKYPVGTLFLRKYVDEKEQGHVAVLCELDSMCGKIIHSYKDERLGYGGVAINTLRDSHFIEPEGFYQFAVLPKNWLSTFR